MVSRPPKPDFLLQYEEWLRAGPPRCCHTCDHFSADGKCFVFGIHPPMEFVNSQGQCDKWDQELPF
jgi:hypothetical protein